MAIRGVVTSLLFYPADYDVDTEPLYAFQNHFPESREILIPGVMHVYNSFQISPIIHDSDINSKSVSITFVATAANVDLVEAAVTNAYAVYVVIYRWSSGEGLNDPSAFNLFSGYVGSATGGSADLSTVSLEVANYNNNLNIDLPWRKIPWTILGPLSFRR